MQIKVVAKNDKGCFAGLDSEGNYYVLTLDDIREIQLGDVLEGEFDGIGSLFYSVRNLSQGGSVKICLESWESTQAQAFDFLGKLGAPTKIYTLN